MRISLSFDIFLHIKIKISQILVYKNCVIMAGELAERLIKLRYYQWELVIFYLT